LYSSYSNNVMMGTENYLKRAKIDRDSDAFIFRAVSFFKNRLISVRNLKINFSLFLFDIFIQKIPALYVHRFLNN